MREAKTIVTQRQKPSHSKGTRYSATDKYGNRMYVAKQYNLSDFENHKFAATLFVKHFKWAEGSIFSWGGELRDGYVFIVRART